MAAIDLRDYIGYSSGVWCDETVLQDVNAGLFTQADTLSRDRLMMRWGGDQVILFGPLRIRVTFQAENLTSKRTFAYQSYSDHASASLTSPAANTASSERPNLSSPNISNNRRVVIPGEVTLQASTIYSYVLDIPPGHEWSFTYRVGETDVGQMIDSSGYLGRNLYDRVVIEPTGPETVAAPVATGDLPCNLAVASYPDTASFFPAACETCEPGAQVRMPPLSPTLSIPSADGGCTRSRFFNGMCITKEDLETEQRYLRVKNRLHNRTIGQGVVWGLDVFRQGEHICVMPGYGIDCCGNDLTVTSLYKVEIAALLRDPAAAVVLAAATTEQSQRMHLLLEYVECPSEPRPVHSDPCGPPQQVCEPSRMRETVRLRLVPPRAYQPDGPLKSFLEEVAKLEEQPQIAKAMKDPQIARLFSGMPELVGGGIFRP